MFARNNALNLSDTNGLDFRIRIFQVVGKPKKHRASHTITSEFYQTMTVTKNTKASNISKFSKKKIDVAQSHSKSTLELERVYFTHFDALVRSARVLVDDLSSASDVVQESFVKALVTQPQFENDNALAYMKTAVINQARSALRKRGVARKHLSVVPIEDTNITAKAQEELRVDAQIIHSALSKLSARQRECVMLAHTYAMTHKEIAGQLGISEGSVKQHLSRGLKNLSDALEGEK